MAVTIKKSQIRIKNSQTGSYMSVDVLGEKSTADYITDIANKGTEVLNSIPQDYTSLLNCIINEFDASSFIAKDKYVRNGNGFYKLIEDHEIGTSWANTEKEPIVSMDEIVKLGQKLTLQYDNVPNTIQSYTYDTDGNLQTVVHKDFDDNVIRTDSFTFGSQYIVEVRTLATGESLTISTDVNSLATTILYANA